MVKNVGNFFGINKINNIAFKSETQNSFTANISEDRRVTELQEITPDFNTKVPQKYSKLGVTKLNNGLEIHSYMLENGHRVTIIPMEGSPATVKNYVNVGSMNETDDIKGISHFLEHMAFNGTTGENGYKKLVWGDCFKLTNNMGGWTNASTNYAITDYVNSSQLLDDNDINEQIRILAAMTEDLALPEDMVEKEKNPVCSEINMIMDDPQIIAQDQTVRTLFNIKSSADELIGGSTNHIKYLDRNKVKEYYDKYYTPDNMNLVITGDVEPDKIIEIVSKEFRSKKKPQGKKYEEKLSPINSTIRKDFISDKASETNIVIGFTGPASNDAKSQIIMEVISHYLNSEEFGLSKKMRDLNAQTGYSSEKISSNPYNPNICTFNIYTSEENSEKALKAVFDKFAELKAPDEKTLKQIKEQLLMSYKDYMEYSGAVNNIVGRSILNGNLDYLTKYEDILNSINKDDIDTAIKKYIDVSKAAITVVHPNVSESQINENYRNVNFKGSKRKPLDTKKVTETTLSNNYKTAFYDTKNDNISFEINMEYDIPKDINPAAFLVLSHLYDTGIEYKTEEEHNKFNEENNIDNYVSVGNDHLTISGYSSYENFELNFNNAFDLYNHPRINDEEIAKAIEKIKDSILRQVDTSDSLYADYESQFDPHYVARQTLLDNLDKVTKYDIYKLCNYISENSKGYIVLNSPENDDEFKAIALDKFSRFKTVKPYKIKKDEVYHETEAPVVLTKERPVSQADISQIYKFRVSNDIKEKAIISIMNSLLSNSDSIGLFNSLRERDHLAYSVYSDNNRSEDCGTIQLNILTTTDNKENNEISYENLQKSIFGFNRQISLLLDSAYTDEDFESAKRGLKARLLDQEGIESKLAALSVGIENPDGIEYKNKAYEIIDSITREDIDNMAHYIFSKKPIYSIVASKDTLEANKEYLENLKN